MRGRTGLLIAGLLLPLLGGCDGRKTTGVAGAGMAQQDVPADNDMPAEAPTARPVEAGGPGWEIAITGEAIDLPAVSGRSVMTMNMPGGLATYRFTSSAFMGSIDLADTRVGEAGDFEPYNVQFNWLQEQWTCGMSSLNRNENMEVRIESTANGYRGTISGGVECVPAVGGTRRPARVEGWFEK